jgi:large subunit ribosomal protein L17
MRHQKAGKKLNRTGSHRNAMFRNMVTSLFEHGRIHTTDVKAKELRRWADHMITLAKRGDLHSRRQALAVMRNKTVVHKLFEEAPDRFGDRAGGYTNVFRIGRRRGDAAPISLVELVAPKEKKERKKKKSRAAKKEVDKDKKEAPVKTKEREKSKTSKKAAQQAAPEIGKVTASDIEDNKGSDKAEAGSEGPESTETKEDKEQK